FFCFSSCRRVFMCAAPFFFLYYTISAIEVTPHFFSFFWEGGRGRGSKNGEGGKLWTDDTAEEDIGGRGERSRERDFSMEQLTSVASRALLGAAGGNLAQDETFPEAPFLFGSKSVCVHGKWYVENLTCVCNAGWTSDPQQNALAPKYFLCNLSVPLPLAAENGFVDNFFGDKFSPTALIILLFLFVTVIICFLCRCIRCCRDSDATDERTPQSPQMQQGMVSVPAEFPNHLFGSVSAAPAYMMSPPRYPECTTYLPPESPYHNPSAGFGSAYIHNDPFAEQPIHMGELQHAAGNLYPITSQNQPMPDYLQSGVVGEAENGPFAPRHFPHPEENTSKYNFIFTTNHG
ncbi:adenylate kinase, putative, partial [Trypanosoma cruzi marinkellei]